jgi:two-component system, NarL family, sensor histidine kinase UhpB
VVNAAIAGTVLLLSVALGLYLAFGLTRPLAATIAAVRRIRGGDYAIEMGVTAGGEIGDLQSSIKEMAGSLDEFRRDLESKVAARTHDLEAARDDAIKSNAEKRRLIQKVNSAVEEERRNIAVEIHDHLNAVLIVARLEAQRILDLAESDSTSQAASEIKTRALSVIKLTLDLYEEARSIVRRLRPEVIDTLGLRDAVEEMVRHYDTLQSQCRLEFHAEGSMSSPTFARRRGQSADSPVVHCVAARLGIDERMPGNQRSSSKISTARRCSVVSAGASITVGRRPAPPVVVRTNVALIRPRFSII